MLTLLSLAELQKHINYLLDYAFPEIRNSSSACTRTVCSRRRGNDGGRSARREWRELGRERSDASGWGS
jgi:hypothetical protein